MEVYLLSRSFHGWTLEEIRGLTVRERKNWISMVLWQMGASSDGQT